MTRVAASGGNDEADRHAADDEEEIVTARGPLVLSVFPGIGLLDRGFEQVGFCVVRGPDLLWGGDVRRFHPPAGHFAGVIGGSPCQDFSSARRAPPTGYGQAMLDEFVRVVAAACPAWWLLENVSRVPRITVPGFPPTQRLPCDAAWYGHGRRLRHIQWSALNGSKLQLPRGVTPRDAPGAALANDKRSLEQLAALQGCAGPVTLPGFTKAAAKAAIGNGVPRWLALVLAQAVAVAVLAPAAAAASQRYCMCGCGRIVTGRRNCFDFACRKRLQRTRDATAGGVTLRNGRAKPIGTMPIGTIADHGEGVGVVRPRGSRRGAVDGSP
jgi:DNA (cytosine-5)-methyltransferase 1